MLLLVLVLLSHFLSGCFAPFLIRQTVDAVNEYRHKSDWLNSGYIYHNDHRNTRNRLWRMVAVVLCYAVGYSIIIVISIRSLLFLC